MNFNDLPPDVQQHWILHCNACDADHSDIQELKQITRRWLKGQDGIPVDIPMGSNGWPHPAYIHDYLEILLGLENG